jgi:hypothetical protein
MADLEQTRMLEDDVVRALILALEQARGGSMAFYPAISTGAMQTAAGLPLVMVLELALARLDGEAWIVGRHLKGAEDLETGEHLVAWDFQGVFTSEDLAVAACRDDRYFVAPAKMNQQLPHDTAEWPGCYYPKQPVAQPTDV